jgi:hypothetical protein
MTVCVFPQNDTRMIPASAVLFDAITEHGSRSGLGAASAPPGASARTPTRRRRGRQVSLAVIERDGACIRCGGDHRLSADHVIPREERGPDVPANLETLCVSCHGRATAAERRA